MTPSRPSPSWLTLVLVCGLGLAGAQAPAQDLDADMVEALRLSADVERGRVAFEPCATCHRASASGRSDGAVPRLSGQHGPVIIKQVGDIRSGKRVNPEMKPFVVPSELTLQALADIAAYLERLPITGTPGKGPGTALERGRTLFQRDCAACHGPAGEGLAAGFFPMLAAQHYGYLLRELEMIRDGRRGNSNPGMVQVVRGYTPEDLAAVADHASRLAAPTR